MCKYVGMKCIFFSKIEAIKLSDDVTSDTHPSICLFVMQATILGDDYRNFDFSYCNGDE